MWTRIYYIIVYGAGVLLEMQQSWLNKIKFVKLCQNNKLCLMRIKQKKCEFTKIHENNLKPVIRILLYFGTIYERGESRYLLAQNSLEVAGFNLEKP